MKHFLLLSSLLLMLAPMWLAEAGAMDNAATVRPSAEETRSVTLDITGMT